MRALHHKHHGNNRSSGCSYYWRFSSTLVGLLVAWNDATAPNVLRTDHQHSRCSQAARAIDNRLAFEQFYYGIHWGEYSDGTRKLL